MADNTPSSGSIIRPYRTPWGAFHVKGYVLNADSTASTITKGQIVQASTLGSSASGRIELASSLSTAIVGVAGEDRSTVGTMSVYEANPVQEFIGFAKGTLSDTMVGRSFSFAYDSSLGIHYIDLANSSAADARVLILGYHNSTAGDTNGEMVFRFRTTDGLATSTGQGYVLAYYR